MVRCLIISLVFFVSSVFSQSSSRQSGNTIYNSDGTSSRKSGNTWYHSD